VKRKAWSGKSLPHLYPPPPFRRGRIKEGEEIEAKKFYSIDKIVKICYIYTKQG